MASSKASGRHTLPDHISDEDQDVDQNMDVPGLEDLCGLLIVGDIHFQKDAFLQGEELIEKLISVAQDLRPTRIILLGDILDNHETVRHTQYKQAEKLIDGLRQVAPLDILMGNHDLINQSQFLTDAHFFGPFKEWAGVTIVDIPTVVTIPSADRQIMIVMCPYVPPGRFIEALNTLFDREEPVDWQLADCILGHQEIRGVSYNGRDSTKGDVWDEAYPPLICGHIHEPCQVGPNVYYVGSARQVAANESPNKRVWYVTFDEEPGFQRDEIDLGLKARKEIEMDYEDVKTFDFGLVEQYHIKLKLRGTREQFKTFRKSQLHAKLTHHGVKIAFVPTIEANPLMINLAQALRDDVSFESILREVVKKKPRAVQEVYEEMYGCIDDKESIEEFEETEEKNETVYELVFVD